MTIKRIGILLLIAFALAACATQPAPMADDTPGFFSGLWNGFTAPFALIGSIFGDMRIYAFPNSGWWYDFGYLLGFCTIAGGGGSRMNR